MSSGSLSKREEEIISLCIEGLTNDAIARQLGISVGTVNTYWLRIKLKVGGYGRADTVARVLGNRADFALSQERIDWKGLEDILAKRGTVDRAREAENRVELQIALSLLHWAIDQVQTTVWATDKNLVIHVIANGELCSTRLGVAWEKGNTIYELFKTSDKSNPAVAAHLGALAGSESEQRLTGDFANMILKVLPLADEDGTVIGCMSTLSCVADKAGRMNLQSSN